MDSDVLVEKPEVGRKLRFHADNYERAQRIRIEVGERIRAVLQGRDATWPGTEAWVAERTRDIMDVMVEKPLAKWSGLEEEIKLLSSLDVWQIQKIVTDDDTDDIDIELLVNNLVNGVSTPDRIQKAASKVMQRVGEVVLSEVERGVSLGPVPPMGRAYHRYSSEEKASLKDMEEDLANHPAWPWLGRVRGIGTSLGCKLLARLDPTKAPHASSFWSYCGLATVPGNEYRCGECGLVRGWPVDFNVSGDHKGCSGKLVKVKGPEDGVRVAQPRPRRGEKSSYDQYMKKVVLGQVVPSFLKAGGAYEQYWRRERAKADRERPGWSDGRKKALADRKTVKLFLSHLWQIWREELGLPTGEPYIHAQEPDAGHELIIPDEMVEI